jgi:predicted DNA-binding WGR domain protein
MRLELSEGTSNKFWEATIAGSVLTTKWGKIGGSVSSRVHELASEEAAIKQRDKLLREKLGKGYLEVGGAKPAAKAPAAKQPKAAPAKSASGIKPSELVVTQVQEVGRGRVSRLAIAGTTVVAGGARTLASTDGAHFHPRAHPGTVYALIAIDGAVYSCGGPLSVTRDLGKTWREIKTPANGNRFSILRDSAGTWWHGCDDGLVLTSKHPERGWKAAPFTLKDRVLHITEAAGKLFFAGPQSAVWDGKKVTRMPSLKGVITRITEAPSGALIAIGDAAVCYRSTDHGKSWKPVSVPVKGEDLEDCAWVAGALFVVGGGPTLLRSTNGGESFTKVPVKLGGDKLWGIASWGDGAFIGSERGALLKLASPKDTYWRGCKDELVPPPPTIDADFVPAPAPAREAEYTKLALAANQAYKPTADTRAPDANPALAKLVDADVEGSTDALDVYADYLQDHDDPRGTLAAVQLKLAHTPKDKALLKAERELMKTHAGALLGPFAKLSDILKLEWRGGFIHAARIASSLERDPEFDGTEESAVDIAKLVIALLDLPSARFLRALTVGIVQFDENSYDAIIKAIGKRHYPALRSLFLGDFDGEETELSWSDIGNAQSLYAALPNLRSLRLRSGQMSLGKIVHPTLEEFTVTTGGLDRKNAKAIASAVWPSLRTLQIAVGQPNYGGDAKLADFAPILAGEGLPRLRHLGLTALEYTDAAVEALARSKILPQLERLDLSLGMMSDDGVRLLYRYQKAFRHLQQIDVSDNFITNAGARLLKSLKLPIEIGDQRDDEGDPSNRYTAVGE